MCHVYKVYAIDQPQWWIQLMPESARAISKGAQWKQGGADMSLDETESRPVCSNNIFLSILWGSRLVHHAETLQTVFWGHGSHTHLISRWKAIDHSALSLFIWTHIDTNVWLDCASVFILRSLCKKLKFSLLKWIISNGNRLGFSMTLWLMQEGRQTVI